MSVQGIRTHPDAILYRAAREATADDFQDSYVRTVAQDLADTMEALEERTGRRPLGLAAPQIGHGIRIFRLAQWPGAFVNPELECVLGRPVWETEACYSLPGVELVVGRAAKIRLRYFTISGEERATKMRDRDARAAQHEYDHLNGVTILQRADGGAEL